MSDPLEMATKPSFIMISIDQSLVPPRFCDHNELCDNCLITYQNRCVMAILPNAQTIGDVLAAIKAKYRINKEIKLWTNGVFFPPDLPVQILKKFEKDVFR